MSRQFLLSLIACTLLSISAGATAEPLPADLILRGDYLLTMDPARPLIEDGAVVVRADRIAAVGSWAELQGR